MKHYIKLLLVFFILGTMFSCEEEPNPLDLVNESKDPATSLEEMNRYKAKQEKLKINNWISKRGLKYEDSGTGLRYRSIVSEGDTTNIISGMRVRVRLKVFLLDGTEIYNTDQNGHFDFSISYDLAESGLHEACTYMHIGDSSSLLMPSHLAHGNFGDFKKIPPFSPIRMEVRMLNAVH